MRVLRVAAVLVALVGVAVVRGFDFGPIGPTQYSSAADAADAPAQCDTADLPNLLQHPRLYDQPATTRHDLWVTLSDRLSACAYNIGRQVDPTATPTPPPWWVKSTPATPVPTSVPPNCLPGAYREHDSTLVELYSALEKCASLAKALSPSPSSPPPITMARKAFYVFSAGTVDATTSALVVREVASRLETAERRGLCIRTLLVDPAACYTSTAPLLPLVVSRPDWSSDTSYLTQCQLDTNTFGALFIKGAVPQTRSLNYVLWNDQQTLVKASVELRDCADDAHNVNASPLALWSSTPDSEPHGSSHQGGVSLGIVAGAAGLFAKSTTTQTITASPLPTTAPAIGASTPVPAQNQTATATTTTPLSAPLLIGTAASALSSQVFPAQNAPVTTQLAAERFAEDVLSRLNDRCNDQALYNAAVLVDPTLKAAAPPDERFKSSYKAAWEFAKYCDAFYDFDSAPLGISRRHRAGLMNPIDGTPATDSNMLPSGVMPAARRH